MEIDPGFSEYISAFTSGTIPVQSCIRIELAKPAESVELNTEVNEKYFSMSPGIEGKTYWINNKTLEFRPDKPLQNSQTYECKFYLSKIIKNLPSKYRDFNFEFQTITQELSVVVNGYEPYTMTSLTWNFITGVVNTADVTDNNTLEKILKAAQNDKNLSITWMHDDIKNEHKFKIDSVIRSDKESTVKVSWNGLPVKVKNTGEAIIKIPSIYDFSVIEAKATQGTQQYISIRFSDPLQANQDLTGLITLNNSADCTFEIDGMTIKVFPSTNQKGSLTVNIESGIKNAAGAKLKEKHSFEVLFENIKPGIKLIGKGSILPDSKGLILPFSAVNLKAVDLRIIKIFENNIGQFLQVNQLDGEYELKRAGRLILKKTIRLDAEKQIDFTHYNTFSIDLSTLIKQEPGAIYRVELSFLKKYSTYPCSDATEDHSRETMSSVTDINDKDSENEIDYWDSPENNYENYDYEYGYNYNWQERDDPCKLSYYTGQNTKVSRNIIASNLGIIAKGASDNTLTVAVANIITTRPLGGIDIEVYNYQNQKIGTGKTDKDGICIIPLSNKPFLLIAKNGDERGYLRVDDGNALALSNFDVSGETIQKGLKGFIYGERGVWRPGDTIYLNFILEDKLKKLPANHPVVLEIYNPQGQLFKRIIKTAGINGFYLYKFSTSENDQTGNWMAYIKIGGTTFSKTLKIETIKPNRLKIQFNLNEEILKGTFHANLNAKWLHGAPAKNMKASVAVTLFSTNTNFKGYNDFVFDDPLKKFQNDEKPIFEGLLDEKGNVDVKADLSAGNNAPGMLKANFLTRVFEPGGEFSIDRFTVPFSPYTSYVGVKPPKSDWGYLYTDTNQVFEVATVSPEGLPVNKNNLEFKIYKLEWRWWWDSGNDNMANFVNNTYSKPVFETKVSTVNGKADVKYKINYPDWGRFLVHVTDPESGHSTGTVVYFDWPGWRGRADRGDGKGAAMLMFNSDKKSYVVGEKATITVPSTDGGRMLVSLESGSQVLNTFWVETQKKETKATFDITDKMTPNIFVNVSLIQPHAQVNNDLPIRLYGVIPIMVENAGTHLTPVISMPDVMEPEKPVLIKVSEKNNHPMTYTLEIVDDGLLDLTRFKTPDPWNSFYAKEALGVKTWDLYDDVIGSYSGKIESLFAIGGDEEIKGGVGRKANRFKPVVQVLGPFTLNSGSNTHQVTLPEYIGSVRVMVVAGDNDAFGKAEKTVPVKMPLMLLATLPRVLGPGETVSLPVSIFAMEKKIKNFSVEVVPNEFFNVTDEKSKTVYVNDIGEYDLAFQLKTSSREGIGKVKVIAASGTFRSQYDIEINIRNPNLRIVKYFESVVESGKSSGISYSLIGTAGTNSAKLEVSSVPPIDLSRRLDYLIHYPYGCVEQTTSSAFPQLFLDKLVQLNPGEMKDKDNNIKNAIQRLNSMLVYSGGFAYWPGEQTANEWGTSYAGHFLLEAESRGYAIPGEMKRNWLGYQQRMARNWRSSYKYNTYEIFDDELTQAYRLYTLAVAKQPDMGAMNRMKEITNLTNSASWRLAAAYALTGQADVAKNILAHLSSDIKLYGRFNSTFGSEERDMAMMLETLTLMGNKTEAFKFVKKVSAALSGKRWLSTQTTAYSLLAISKFLESEKTSQEIQFSYNTANKQPVKVDTHVPIVQINLGNKIAGDDKAAINNTGKGVLFARVTTSGIPAVETNDPFENNLKISVAFRNLKGENIDVSRLEQGTDFVLDITVKNMYSSDVTNMVLKQVVASGWEIGNDRMDKEEISSASAKEFTYQDIRDDRVLTFFNLMNNESKTFRIRLTAAYAGRYYLPGTLCEAMYEPGVNAFIPGKWVEVIK